MTEEKGLEEAVAQLIARLEDGELYVDAVDEAVSMLRHLQKQARLYQKRWQEEQEARRQTDLDNFKLVEELQTAERVKEHAQRVIHRQFDAMKERDHIIKGLKDTEEYGTHLEETEYFYRQGYEHGLVDGERQARGVKPHGPRMKVEP